MRKGRTVPVTPEEKRRRDVTRAENSSALMNAIVTTLSSPSLLAKWLLYEDLHKSVNVFMRQVTGNKNYDIEFVHLGAALQRFDESVHEIEWRVEKSGRYQSQSKNYLRLKQSEGEKNGKE